MIWNPKPGMVVRINYKDKSLPYQGCEGEVVAVGRSIKNALVKLRYPVLIYDRYDFYAVIPRGNLNYL